MERKDYKELFQALMPKGPAWSREPDAKMSDLAEAVAAFFFFIHGRVEKAKREMFPQDCEEILIDWERELGLPETCEHGNHAEGQTFQERVNEVIAKINRSFSPTIANFTKLAQSLGYNVRIVTTPPAICGLARCGDRLGGNTAANYYWITIVDGARLTYARCGTAVCGEPLCRISWADDLECLLNRIKPAHTIIKLSYGQQ